MIDDLEVRPVVARRQVRLGDRHADAVAEALSERSGGGFHAGSHAAFGVAGSAALPLAKPLDLVERHSVAGEMEHAVDAALNHALQKARSGRDRARKDSLDYA
jgi:hypothetical protein